MSDIETGPEQGQHDEPGEGAEETPYLTRSKMLPVEGVVYCLEHTAVHANTDDPFGYGEPDCTRDEHRSVYYRGHKGDIDEAPDHGEGSQPLIAPAADTGEALSEEERALVLWLMRQAHATTLDVSISLRQIFGDADTELAVVGTRLELLDGVLRKLGNGGE